MFSSPLTLMKLSLQQAQAPTEYIDDLICALRSSSPLDRNRAIALHHHTQSESSKFIHMTEKVMHKVYDIVRPIFPGAYVVYGRKKDFLSYAEKIAKRDDILSVQDAYALRLILSDKIVGKELTTAFCFRVAKALIDGLQNIDYYVDGPLTANYDGPPSEEIKSKIYIPSSTENLTEDELLMLKDYITHPKQLGYQSVHMIVRTNTGLTVEIQIRTSTMHLWAEDGPASHDNAYKPTTNSLKAIAKSRGEEFWNVLATPSVIGTPLFRDTALEEYPRNFL